jgi:hypothetical protein
LDYYTQANEVIQFVSEDSGNWRLINGLVQATYKSAAGGQQTMGTQSTITDAAGASISCEAGVWLLLAVIPILNLAASNITVACYIRDGSNSAQQGKSIVVQLNGASAITLACIVTPRVTTTYKVSAANNTIAGSIIDSPEISAARIQ